MTGNAWYLCSSGYKCGGLLIFRSVQDNSAGRSGGARPAIWRTFGGRKLNVKTAQLVQGLENHRGKALDAAETKKLEQLAVEEWKRIEDKISYELLLDRFQRLRKEKLLDEIPTEAQLQSDFGLAPQVARKLRRELADDRVARRKELKDALQDAQKAKKVKDQTGHEYHDCSMPDYIGPDFLSLSDEAERKRIAKKAKVTPTQYRVKSLKPSRVRYFVDPTFIAELVGLL